MPAFLQANGERHPVHLLDLSAGGAKLNCPGEEAFATAVTVLKVNEAIAAQKMLTFAPDDFVVKDT
jgi:hypothetical protein